jgi:hypothetical protein
MGAAWPWTCHARWNVTTQHLLCTHRTLHKPGKHCHSPVTVALAALEAGRRNVLCLADVAGLGHLWATHDDKAAVTGGHLCTWLTTGSCRRHQDGLDTYSTVHLQQPSTPPPLDTNSREDYVMSKATTHLPRPVLAGALKLGCGNGQLPAAEQSVS